MRLGYCKNLSFQIHKCSANPITFLQKFSFFLINILVIKSNPFL